MKSPIVCTRSRKIPLVAALSLLAVLALAAPVHAECLEEIVECFKRDFQRVNCWPEPFVRADRVATRVPFAMMVACGWQQQNLLSSFHFEENGIDLNEAGQLKVRSILAETPPHHRTIYVERADTEARTAARLVSVGELAGRFAVNDEVPNVVVSNGTHAGWPAEQVDAIGRKFQASTPEPRLPEMKRESGN
jgi:hypothetical protein